jgi:multidrug efflux pump subunit AcrA (membrane-fusion protein)
MQKRLLKISYTLTLLGLVLVTACSGLTGGATPTPTPAAAEDITPVVNATGLVVPARYTTLSVTAGGVIAELLVEADDMVTAGQPLLRLEGTEDLQAAVAAAQLAVVAAQHDLDLLSKDLDLRLTQANQAVVDAKQALRDAERRQYNVELAAKQVDIDQAHANLVLARDKLEKALEDYEPYADKPEDNLTRAAYLSVKAQAEEQHDAAVRLLNNLLAGANDLDVAEAQAEAGVAQAQLDVAQREYEMLQKGPDPQDVKLAEEQLTNAKAQLKAASAALHDLELQAPFDGTVSELYVRQSQWIAPGQPVLSLADLGHLRVETTDLNEIDVARLDVGNSAIVTFDALPNVSVKGEVVRIAPKASEGSGVNYTVLVELDEVPPKLRWSMTAFVDIEVAE